VDPTCQKPRRPASGPADLSAIPTTLEDLRRPHQDSERPVGLVAQVSLLDRGAALPAGPRIAGSSLYSQKETFLTFNQPR
jgi:hypothetical protein